VENTFFTTVFYNKAKVLQGCQDSQSCLEKAPIRDGAADRLKDSPAQLFILFCSLKNLIKIFSCWSRAQKN